mgnify:CR=1 FL=1
MIFARPSFSLDRANYFNYLTTGPIVIIIIRQIVSSLCFILKVDGVCAASITVICDYEKKDGYIHMVACKPEFRGRGLGNLLNDVALWVLKTEGMQTAYLTTDDWRIPAIKTYLKASFEPDTETCPDYKERWEKIFEKINSK